MQPATEGSLDSVAGFVLGKGSEKRKGDALGRAREVYRQGAGRLLLPGSVTKRPAPHNQTFYRQRRPPVVSRKDLA